MSSQRGKNSRESEKMATIKICDVCLKNDKNAMVKATRRVGYKGDLKMDACETCAKMLGTLSKPEFAKLMYASMGITLTDEEVVAVCKRR